MSNIWDLLFGGQNPINQVLASPASGAAGPLAPRALVAADVPAGAGFPAAQVGDTVRYNVNADSAWDAVISCPKFIYMATETGGGTYYGGMLSPGTCTVAGTAVGTNPTTTDNPGITYTAAVTASGNTVAYVQMGTAANNGSWGFASFYRISHRVMLSTTGAATATAGGGAGSVRYWMGLTQYNNGSPAPINSGANGNASMCLDYPLRPLVAYRYSSGVDAGWTAYVAVTSTQSSTVATGVAPNLVTPQTLDIAWSGSSYIFLINGAIVATISTNLPSATALGTFMFTCADNKNTTSTNMGFTFYHTIQTLK